MFSGLSMSYVKVESLTMYIVLQIVSGRPGGDDVPHEPIQSWHVVYSIGYHLIV